MWNQTQDVVTNTREPDFDLARTYQTNGEGQLVYINRRECMDLLCLQALLADTSAKPPVDRGTFNMAKLIDLS